jgi:hypothetical protein
MALNARWSKGCTDTTAAGTNTLKATAMINAADRCDDACHVQDGAVSPAMQNKAQR